MKDLLALPLLFAFTLALTLMYAVLRPLVWAADTWRKARR